MYTLLFFFKGYVYTGRHLALHAWNSNQDTYWILFWMWGVTIFYLTKKWQLSRSLCSDFLVCHLHFRRVFAKDRSTFWGGETMTHYLLWGVIGHVIISVSCQMLMDGHSHLLGRGRNWYLNCRLIFNDGAAHCFTLYYTFPIAITTYMFLCIVV